jgi:hypothetical protein
MRIRIMLISMCFGFYFVQAQSKISFGLGTGLNISGMENEPAYFRISDKNLEAFTGYAFVNSRFSKVFSLQSELGYYGFGGIRKDDIQGPADGIVGLVTITTHLNYLNFSLLPKFSIPNTGVSIFAGPAVGFLLGSKTTYQIEAVHPEYVGSFIVPKYNNLCGFAVTGIEYVTPFGMGLSARYLYGFENILSDFYSEYPQRTTKIHSVNICVFYQFTSGGKK